MTAFVEGHMSRTGEVVALSRVRSRSRWSVLVSTYFRHAGESALGMRVGDVNEYALVSKIRCRRVSEASPLDNDVHTYVVVGVGGRTAFHLVVD